MNALFLLEKGVEKENIVVTTEDGAEKENKLLLKNVAAAIAGEVSNAGMDSVYGKILDDMLP